MAKVYHSPEGKGSSINGILIGIAVSVLLFLAIPLTQIFTDYEKAPESIEGLEMAPPPPPSPPEEPPPPPEPEEEEPPPEFETPPPPITLEQLDMALEPGTGGSLSGDFALPTFDVSAKDLGGLDIFDINDLDSQPIARRQVAPRFPTNAKRKGLAGRVTAEFIINESGDVIDVTIQRSTDPIFDKPTIDAIRSWKFTAGEKDGRKVKTRTRVTIPYTIN